MGTLAYMSPEAQRGKISTSGDVYSLGITFMETLTGLPVWQERREPLHLGELTDDVDADDVEGVMRWADTAAAWPEAVAVGLWEVIATCTDKPRRRKDVRWVYDQLCALREEHAPAGV